MTPVQYQSMLTAVVRKAERQTTAVVRAAMTADRFDAKTTAHAVGRIISASNVATSLLADSFVADQTGGFVAISPYDEGGPGRPPDDDKRIATAAYAILRAPGDQVQRIAQLARSEPQQSGRDAVVRGMHYRKIRFYRWQVDDDPCVECKRRTGKSFPASVAPTSHPNCNCTPLPMLKGQHA